METLTRPIFLLTDFGLRDHYVGQVRAVLASIAPGSPMHDITHDVEPYAVDEGAWLLEATIPLLPADAVVLAVVDPGVGTSRRALAVACEGRLFVGPDNGLLSGAFPGPCRPGGVGAASPMPDVRELADPQFRRAAVSHTFHGRDVFAPAAAWVAAGLDYRRLGPPVAEAKLLPPFCGVPDGPGRLRGNVIHTDRYGNLVTTIRVAQLFPAFDLEIAGRSVDTHVRTFADAPPGVPFCHADSSGFVAIAMNQASAAGELGVHRGDPVLVRAR